MELSANHIIVAEDEGEGASERLVTISEQQNKKAKIFIYFL
jgi:hypothetical protein